jgi:hypothetical protein
MATTQESELIAAVIADAKWAYDPITDEFEFDSDNNAFSRGGKLVRYTFGPLGRIQREVQEYSDTSDSTTANETIFQMRVETDADLKLLFEKAMEAVRKREKNSIPVLTAADIERYFAALDS